MLPDAIDQLRYPVGKFMPQEGYAQEDIEAFIKEISQFPSTLENTLALFTPQQWETPYREGGWTIRQVVHHLADSHMNAYIRMKWTLTENTPIIKAYNEKDWAETNEVSADPMLSLSLLKALHVKWVVLLKSLSPADLQKSFIHPETKKEITLARLAGTYAWHGRHHLAHLTSLKERMKW
jgi:hypothetical protein